MTKKQTNGATNGNGGVTKNQRQDSETEEESLHEDDQQQQQQHDEKDGTVTPKKPNCIVSILLTLVRALLLDIPLAILFGLYLSTLVVNHIRVHYLTPQLELMQWTQERQMQETTYYHRICEIEDLTATTVDELVVQPNQTLDGAVNQMLTHGVAVFPDFMEDDLVDKLREFVMDRNKKEPNFWVIEGQHRHSFGIGANMDPAVAEALKRIANHPTFEPFITKVCGENPSIIEFTAITSMPGAKDQFWHADVLPYGSQTKASRSFVPSYSLFIPLQDTTAAMGATQVCPGSHVCADEPDYCLDHSFQVSGEQDNWKKGTAFLFNQAFYHRGTGHSDFNAPARATFILTFAPRPLFGKGELETRMISQGGSYSLKWDHWGHTLADLKEADTIMKNPWLTLRAMGIYKPPHKDWGWDMVSVASIRITNDDNGYHEDNLEDFLDGGGFYYLPNWLQGSMESGGPDSENTLWYDYLTETLLKCKAFMETVNLYVLVGYLVLLAVLDIILWMASFNKTAGKKKKKKNGFASSVLLRCMVRLMVTHGLVAAMAWYAVHRVDSSQWAHQIKSGMLYRLPLAANANDTPETKDSLYATLPNVHDVLIPVRMNSDYLASYNDFIHVGHPANREWKEMIAKNCKGYYSTLPPSMREQVAQGIVDTVKERSGRFLSQGYGSWGRWVELANEHAVLRTHRELLMESHPALKALNTKLEHLLSETKFGYHHRTALHRVHIPKLLTSLQTKLMPDNSKKKKKKSVTAAVKKPRSRSGLGPLHKLQKVGSKSTKHKPCNSTSMPPRPVGQEPFESAWLKEGDIVEGMYHGSFPEWYKGTVTYASSYEGSYNVRYDDGEEDIGLCRACVRPFQPYAIDEKVEARMGDPNDEFSTVRVVAVHPDGSYQVMSDENNDAKRLFPQDMRRTYSRKLKVGSPVEARYQGGDEWYRGYITNIRKEGTSNTYDVLFDDGDREYNLPKSDVRVLMR